MCLSFVVWRRRSVSFPPCIMSLRLWPLAGVSIREWLRMVRIRSVRWCLCGVVADFVSAVERVEFLGTCASLHVSGSSGLVRVCLCGGAISLELTGHEGVAEFVWLAWRGSAPPTWRRTGKHPLSPCRCQRAGSRTPGHPFRGRRARAALALEN